MRDRAAFLTLVSELEGDYREIFRVRDHNLRAWGRIEAGADDILDCKSRPPFLAVVRQFANW